MIESVVVIGIGSFGGFFAKNLSNLQSLKLLTIIDPDIVEEKNIINSIYRVRDIGKSKVDCLKEIINFYSPDLNILECNTSYKEGEIKLPKSDLVFDCRDEIVNRKGEIDVRFYISFKKLIIDCRKNTKTKERKGRYIEYISKIDIMNAALQAYMLISNKVIFDLIRRNEIQSIDLDTAMNSVCGQLEENQNNDDFIIDNESIPIKIPNLKQKLHKISRQRTITKEPIPVYVGPKEFPFISSSLPECNIVDYDNTANMLKEVISNLPLVYNNYVIRFVKEGNKSYIELLPETGGA